MFDSYWDLLNDLSLIWVISHLVHYGHSKKVLNYYLSIFENIVGISDS